MESPFKGRHFLSVTDFSTEEIVRVLDADGHAPDGDHAGRLYPGERGGSTSPCNRSDDRRLPHHHEQADAGADVLYTDVWASMGQEDEAEARKRIFASYRIDAETMKATDAVAIFLHCLPAHYGDEIDYATSRLPNAAIFDQAENCLHTQKTLLLHLLGKT